MKQALKFITSEQFQSFTSQLFSEEFPSYQAIEGAGGDGGLDGIEESTAYQIYFPEVKNRDKRHYLAKIDNDLKKLQSTIEKHSLVITRWIFVVPDDLGTDVVLYLNAKAKELGFECIYWGATKLTALVNKYPYIRDAFPEVFLPDVKQDLADVKDGVESLHRKQDSFTDIMTDEEFFRRRKRLAQDGQNKAKQMASRINGSAATQVSQVVMGETNKAIQELTEQKARSDRFYQLAQDEINDFFNEELTKKQSEIAARGMTYSGLSQLAIVDVEKKRTRELERLALKYGKNATAS